MKLLRYVASTSDPDAIRLLARGGFGMNPAIMDWEPDRIGLFIEPRKFNDDKEGKYWCLLNKAEAAHLLREWQEDPRYTERVQPEIRNPSGVNYFKNQVDHFRNHMENRKW